MLQFEGKYKHYLFFPGKFSFYTIIYVILKKA